MNLKTVWQPPAPLHVGTEQDKLDIECILILRATRTETSQHERQKQRTRRNNPRLFRDLRDLWGGESWLMPGFVLLTRLGVTGFHVLFYVVSHTLPNVMLADAKISLVHSKVPP
eukprot:485948-Rhodomonas_salina.1